LTEPKTSSLDKSTAAVVQVPENQGEDVAMKNEKIESKIEVEEELVRPTKKVKWDIAKMQERVFNMEV